MKVGIDLSPLQGPHSQRGVGSVITSLINNLPEKVKKSHDFIFYMERAKKVDQVLDKLQLSGLVYEMRDKPLPPNYDRIKLPWKFNIAAKLLRKQLSLFRFWRGINGYDYKDVGVYLHTDQMHAMPHMRGVKKVLIAYDLIPYILERDYLWGYKTARRLGVSYRGSLAAQIQRSTYLYKNKVNARRASKILAISNQTRDDLIKYLGTKKAKISTLYLGVEAPKSNPEEEKPSVRYVQTPWCNVARQFKFKDTPFILFVGGTDPRRKIDDLVIAFDHLRAEGHNIQLVLSGDVLQGPENTPVKSTREALLNSSYSEDIIYLGFTKNSVRNWLFRNALVFVYPSNYEGFGLPVLEAMSFGTPVVTYKNSSIIEIAGDAALYAHDALSIKHEVEKLIISPSMTQQYADKGIRQAAKFTWEQTSKNLVNLLTSS